MKKLVLALAAALILAAGVGQASPLADFSPGRAAVDLAWQPHTFEGDNAFAGGVTVGLGGDWAVSWRQLGYDTAFAGGQWRTRSQELNLIHKMNDNFQLYAGCFRATGDGLRGSPGLAAKQVTQAGAILSHRFDRRTVGYAILGGGDNVTNIEIGLSYRLRPGLELTTTYRHLTVEKVGPAGAKENFRGFGAGVTLKF